MKIAQPQKVKKSRLSRLPYRPTAKGYIIYYVILWTLVLLIAFSSKPIAVSKFGGTTGDFLGAVQQIANATVLVIASATFSNQIGLWLI